MEIKNCIKGFNQGISKVIPPEQTCKIVLRKIQNMKKPILKAYFKIQRASNIPQYKVLGTDYFQQITQADGTNGKGHFDEQALASGLMEMVERYSCRKFQLDKKFFKICSFKELDNGLFQFEGFYSNYINKREVTILEDEELKNAKIRWYHGYSLDGRRVYLPISMIKKFFETTNGFASGNSLEEALLHGICEIIERHCLALIEVSKFKTPTIDITTIQYSTARKIIKSFLSLGNEILIKDFSLGIGLPVIGVVRKISKFDCVVTCGVATHSEEALIRALTENSQTEGSKDTTKKIFSAGHYFANKGIISMDDISNIEDNNLKVELENIEKILDRQNMKISFLNTTDSELDIPSVIVFISNAKYFRKTYAFRNVLMTLIEEFIATHNYNDAEKYIKRAKDVDKKNYLRYLLPLCFCYLKTKQYKKAIGELKKAEKIFSKAAEINMALFNCYRKIGQIERANKELDKAVLKAKRNQQIVTLNRN